MTPYILSILQGSLLVIQVGLASLLVAVVLGMAGALAKLSGRRVAVWSASAYANVIRGIPDLVLMLLLFYGGQIGLRRIGRRLSHHRRAQASQRAHQPSLVHRTHICSSTNCGWSRKNSTSRRAGLSG